VEELQQRYLSETRKLVKQKCNDMEKQNVVAKNVGKEFINTIEIQVLAGVKCYVCVCV
jgi:hypothetical protein